MVLKYSVQLNLSIGGADEVGDAGNGIETDKAVETGIWGFSAGTVGVD